MIYNIQPFVSVILLNKCMFFMDRGFLGVIIKMKINAQLNWNQEVPFENANGIDIALLFQEPFTHGNWQELKPEYKNEWTSPKSVIAYLTLVYYHAGAHLEEEDIFFFWDVAESNLLKTKDIAGERRYVIPVSENLDDDDVPILLRDFELLSKKYHLITREEDVTRPDYNCFYADGYFRSNYPPGDFVETLRQTVYDMENGSPEIYNWTNVPHTERLRDSMESDDDLRKFMEQLILPLEEEVEEIKESINPDIDKLKALFLQIANHAETYKTEKEIERLG